jgi:hypothetical protein
MAWNRTEKPKPKILNASSPQRGISMVQQLTTGERQKDPSQIQSRGEKIAGSM